VAPCDPRRDVVYFRRLLSERLLRQLAANPVLSKELNRLTLHGKQVSGVDGPRTLELLHALKGLKEAFVVDEETGQSQSSETWCGCNGQPWKLPKDAQSELERLKRERWPQWNVPTIKGVRRWETILEA
jgi:hypothetical protein